MIAKKCRFPFGGNENALKLTMVVVVQLCEILNCIVSVQFSLSVVSDSLQPHETTAHQASLSIANSQSLLNFTSIESVMLSNHLILHCPLLLPSVFLSMRVFSNKSVLHIRWPKYWSFSFSITPSNEYSELISFRMD